uniref:AlNc14C181G8225 protein n=1 Tax=Albugo laibachii Nc14 TaxID=890382 RepID=F0WP77_9STRA|nr:AlNc14C181G8225 [Albugo laibachii Nc14]|eukprot:CCA23123.1 AlNc14C181G8225 [Albugo laibachii Nc14]
MKPWHSINQVRAPSSLLKTHTTNQSDETIPRLQSFVSSLKLPPQQKEPNDNWVPSPLHRIRTEYGDHRVKCVNLVEQQTPSVDKLVNKIREQAQELYHLYTLLENEQRSAKKLEQKLLKEKKGAKDLEKRCAELEQMLETKSNGQRAEKVASKFQKLSFDLEHEKQKWSQARVKAQAVLLELEKFYQRVWEQTLGPKDIEDERAQYIQLLERVVHLKADELECSGHEEPLRLLSSLRQTGYMQEIALDKAQREISTLKQQKNEVEVLNGQIEHLQAELRQSQSTLVEVTNDRQRWSLECESQSARLQELEVFNRCLTITVDEQRDRGKKLVRRHQHTRKQMKVLLSQMQTLEQEQTRGCEREKDNGHVAEVISMRHEEREQRWILAHQIIGKKLDDFCHQILGQYTYQNGEDNSPGLVESYAKSLGSILHVQTSPYLDPVASFTDRTLAFVESAFNFCAEVNRVEASYSRESHALRAAVANLQQTIQLYESELAHCDENLVNSQSLPSAFELKQAREHNLNVEHSHQIEELKIQLAAVHQLFLELSEFYFQRLPSQHKVREHYSFLEHESLLEMMQFFPYLIKAYTASCQCDCSQSGFYEENLRASLDLSAKVSPSTQGKATPFIPSDTYTCTQDSIQPIGLFNLTEVESERDLLHDQMSLVQEIFKVYKIQR